jgi:tetratricopeptide (TPR) repeat protein
MKEREKKYLQAVEDFTRALEIDPDFFQVYIRRTVCFRHLGEYQKALQDVEAYIRLRPHDDMAYLARAGCHEWVGNYEAALRDYTQAIELAPEKIEPIYYRAEAYGRLGRAQEAIQDYSRVIEYPRKYSGATTYTSEGESYNYITNAYLKRSLLYMSLSMTAEGLDDLRQAEITLTERTSKNKG